MLTSVGEAAIRTAERASRDVWERGRAIQSHSQKAMSGATVYYLELSPDASDPPDTPASENGKKDQLPRDTIRLILLSHAANA